MIDKKRLPTTNDDGSTFRKLKPTKEIYSAERRRAYLYRAIDNWMTAGRDVAVWISCALKPNCHDKLNDLVLELIMMRIDGNNPEHDSWYVKIHDAN